MFSLALTFKTHEQFQQTFYVLQLLKKLQFVLMKILRLHFHFGLVPTFQTDPFYSLLHNPHLVNQRPKVRTPLLSLRPFRDINLNLNLNLHKTKNNSGKYWGELIFQATMYV